MDKENINIENIDKENIDEENIDKENIDKKSINKENINKENIDKENINKESIDKETSYDEAEIVDQQSKIYLRNIYENNNIYVLKFCAADILVRPIYLKARVFEENETDKCVQPRSQTIYQTKFNIKAKRVYVLQRSYAIDKSSDRVSIMTNKKPLMKAKAREAASRKIKSSISSKTSSIEKSVIYINYKNVTWKLFPGVIDIKQTKPIDYENQEKQQELLSELGMESTEQMQNKANFIIKHKKDVIRVSFSLADISFEAFHEKISQGVQVEDDNAYYTGFSEITDRKVYISIPKTIYDYVDPMIEIKRKNCDNKMKNLEPRWIHDTRMKRLKEYNRCRVYNVYNDIWELRIGSTIYFVGMDCVHKAKTGVIECGIDNEEYENWVIEAQRR